jgi:D-lactate dehydrogenase (cytochrome)
MSEVIEFRPNDLDVTVNPGITWNDLNTFLQPYGLFYPIDPGPGASIGGMCGTNASGTNATRYGMMKSNVLSMTVVMPDGSVIKTANRARKSSAGYDLTSLIVGSEGTLGIVTEATLKLQTLPSYSAVGVASFDSIETAGKVVVESMKLGVQLGAVELMDSKMMFAINTSTKLRYQITPHVFFKFTGASETKVKDDIEKVQQLVLTMGKTDTFSPSIEYTTSKEGREKLWEARKVALWSVQSLDQSRKVASTDVAVPLSALPRLMRDIEDQASASSLQVYAVGHVGDGNIHHLISFDPTNERELQAAQTLNDFIVKSALNYSGTCTGEHGIGVGKVMYLEEEFGKGTVQVMAKIKKALDPLGLMNPGKKLPFGITSQVYQDGNSHFHGATQSSSCPLNVLPPGAESCCGASP